MKHLTLALAAVSVLSAATWASPLQPQQVGADAKWLVHLDLDNFRSTQLGRFVTEHLVNALAPNTYVKGPDGQERFPFSPQEAFLRQLLSSTPPSSPEDDASGQTPKGDQPPFDFQALFEKIHSVTAYGTDFEKNPEANGVLMIDADKEIQQIATAFLIQQSHAAPEGGKAPVQKLPESAFDLFSVNGELFVGSQPDGRLFVSKSESRIRAARQVAAGKAANLSSVKTFSEFPKAPDAFFFLAVAEVMQAGGVAGPGGNALMLPPQAKILQEAEGGRLVLGEAAEKVFLNLILKTKSAQASTQIQQVLQGIIALAVLSQSNNPDLQSLAQSAKVTSETRWVSFDLNYPTAKVLARLKEAAHHAEKAAHQRAQRTRTRDLPQAENGPQSPEAK